MILVCVVGCHVDDLCYLVNDDIYNMQSFLYLSDAKYVILHGLSFYVYDILMHKHIVFNILSSPK